MARKDWEYIGLPKLLTKRLESFLRTPQARSIGIFNKSEILKQSIVNFLEEQEKLYRDYEKIEDFIMEIKDGDHIILTYDNTNQLYDIILSYLKRGINRGQLNLLYISKQEELLFMEFLNKIENINQLFNDQEIIIKFNDDALLEINSFDEYLSTIFNEYKSIRKEKSKNGINIMATIAGGLFERGRHHDALDIENKCNNIIRKIDVNVTLLCIYKSPDQKILDHCLQHHDVIIKRITTSIDIKYKISDYSGY
jgi:hypothetical protein